MIDYKSIEYKKPIALFNFVLSTENECFCFCFADVELEADPNCKCPCHTPEVFFNYNDPLINKRSSKKKKT